MSPDRFRRNATAFALGLAAGVSLVMASCSEPRAADADETAEPAVAVELIAPTDTVQGLVADPARLAAVQEGCRTNAAWVTDELCRAAAEARRRRFRGEGVPYTPERTDLFPTRPEPAMPQAPDEAPQRGEALAPPVRPL